MQSVHYSLFSFVVVSILHQIHVNYYFTSTFCDSREAYTGTTRRKIRKSNEKTRIVQSIASCLSLHTERCCCIFNVFRARYEHTQAAAACGCPHKRVNLNCSKLQKLVWVDVRDREVECGLKWDEVTFEVKILIYGQFENSGLPLCPFPHQEPRTSFWRAHISLTFHGDHQRGEWWQWTRINILCHNKPLSNQKELSFLFEVTVVYSPDKIQIILQSRINYRGRQQCCFPMVASFLMWDYISTFFKLVI